MGEDKQSRGGGDDAWPGRRARVQRAVLIISDRTDLRRRLARQLEALGRSVRTAAAPLDALRWLEDPNDDVGSVIVAQSLAHPGALALLDFFAEEYPQLRRVLLADGPLAEPSSARPLATLAGLVDDDGDAGRLVALLA